MSKTVINTRQKCEDLVRGLAVMGTGGGGDPEWGRSMLFQALDEGREIGWVSVADIPDDAWTASFYGCGSIAPESEDSQNEIKQIGLTDRMGLKLADLDFSCGIEELMNYAGVELSAVISSELGAYNSLVPMIHGGRLGIPTVDGDYAGRAYPEIIQSTPLLTGIGATPASIVDKWGNVILIKNTANPEMYERITKLLSVAAFGINFATGILLQGRDMKRFIISGTFSKCLELGRLIREARE